MEGEQTAAGWYPAPDGTQRYWDGQQWTEHTAPAGPAPSHAGAYSAPIRGGLSDENWILIAHLSPLVLYTTALFGFIGPLVVWLVHKDQSNEVAYHAKESLNFQLTMLLAGAVSALLVLVLIGIVLAAIVALVAIVAPIVAAVASSRGDRFRYPVTIRFVS